MARATRSAEALVQHLIVPRRLVVGMQAARANGLRSCPGISVVPGRSMVVAPAARPMRPAPAASMRSPRTRTAHPSCIDSPSKTRAGRSTVTVAVPRGRRSRARVRDDGEREPVTARTRAAMRCMELLSTSGWCPRRSATRDVPDRRPVAAARSRRAARERSCDLRRVRPVRQRDFLALPATPRPTAARRRGLARSMVRSAP